MNGRDDLLDRPSVIPGDRRCAVCGRYATNRHHVIPKGMGGRKRANERRIPLVLLCGMGNTSGCHGLAHSMRLHFRWEDGWEIKLTGEPMKREKALADEEGWKPMPGWVRLQGEGGSACGRR